MDKFNGIFDRMGIGISSVCLLHCVLLPLAYTGFNFAGISLGFDVFLEMMTLILALLIGGFAMIKGYKTHGKKSYVLIFISGIILLLAASLIHGTSGEIILKSFGAITLIFAHVLNYRMGNCRLKKIN